MFENQRKGNVEINGAHPACFVMTVIA